MAQITDILNLGATRDHPFDIILTTLACQPRLVPYILDTSTTIGRERWLTNIDETDRERWLLQRKWIEMCAEATKWRQVCRIWRECHQEHIVIGSRCVYFGYVAATWWQRAPSNIKHLYRSPEQRQTPVPSSTAMASHEPGQTQQRHETMETTKSTGIN